MLKVTQVGRDHQNEDQRELSLDHLPSPRCTSALRSDTPTRFRVTGRSDLRPCPQRGDTLTKLFSQTNSCK